MPLVVLGRDGRRGEPYAGTVRRAATPKYGSAARWYGSTEVTSATGPEVSAPNFEKTAPRLVDAFVFARLSRELVDGLIHLQPGRDGRALDLAVAELGDACADNLRGGLAVTRDEPGSDRPNVTVNHHRRV